jgi:site-specific recombinase XerD
VNNLYENIPQYAIDYLNYIETIKGLSLKTVKEYYYDLRLFFDYIFAQGIKEISEVTLSTLYSYMGYLTHDRKISAASRCRKTASLQSFFKYLYTKVKMISENPVAELETPKAKKSLPKYLNMNESENLLNIIDGKYNIRDHAIVTLFVNCGLRLSELVSINLSDIKGNQLTILGKGNKERMVYLTPPCIKAIEEYKKVRKVTKKESDALFLSERNQRISTKTVQWMVKKYMGASGLDIKKYSTHKLRHTAATLMYQGGVDIKALQAILGHTNINMTEKYTHIDSKGLEDAYHKHPMNKNNI